MYSVTSLAVYEACPFQYYEAHVLGIPPPRTPAMKRGLSVHKLIADHYRGRQYLPETLDPAVRRLFEDFRESRFNVPPVASEKSFRLQLERGDVRGRIDLVLPGQDRELELVDFKSGQGDGRDDFGSHLQLPLYSLAAADLFEREAEDLTYTYYFLSDKVQMSFPATTAGFGALRRRIAGIMEGIQAERFEPTAGCACYACRRERQRHRRP